MPSCSLLSRVQAVFLDMDGTIYHGGSLYPTTLPFLAFLKERKIPYAFCSNNSSYSKKEYVARLHKYGIAATTDNFYTSTDFLVDKGYDDALGARPLKRVVQRYIEDPLAEMLLRGGLPPKIKITRKKDADELSFS